MRVFLFTKAFDLGIIGYQRVLDVMVHPFLLLAKSCGDGQLRADDIDKVFSSWAQGVSLSLLWHSKSIDGNLEQMKPAMQPSQRAVMVKALLAAKIPEVRRKIKRQS